MKKYFFNVLIVALISVTVYIRFYPNHYELPKGCDEFGYLHLAEAITSNTTFQSHTARSFLPELTEYLVSEEVPTSRFAWMIAPHAYHYDENANKIINQYPPGTSLFLSILPKYQRKVLFPVLIVLSFFLLAHLLFTVKSPNKLKLETIIVLLLLFILFSITSSPIIIEFARVNSVAPSLCLLIMAGIFIKRSPLLSIGLIAISINFRLSNFILLPIFILYFSFMHEYKSIFNSLKKGFLASVMSFILGFSVYSFYAYRLIGNPFASTYSIIDRQNASFSSFLENIGFYFNFNQPWFILNLSLILILFYFYKKQFVSLKLYLMLFISALFTYLFFLFHQAKTPYYPYAIGIIMIGVLIDCLSELQFWTFKKLKMLKIGLIISFILVLTFRYKKYTNHQDRSLERETLVGCFQGYDVLWGELKTGTVEYAVQIPAMRYLWGDNSTKIKTMKWLKQNNYKQVIYLNDLPGLQNEIVNLLTSNDISHTLIESRNCGPIIEI